MRNKTQPYRDHRVYRSRSDLRHLPISHLNLSQQTSLLPKIQHQTVVIWLLDLLKKILSRQMDWDSQTANQPSWTKRKAELDLNLESLTLGYIHRGGVKIMRNPQLRHKRLLSQSFQSTKDQNHLLRKEWERSERLLQNLTKIFQGSNKAKTLQKNLKLLSFREKLPHQRKFMTTSSSKIPTQGSAPASDPLLEFSPCLMKMWMPLEMLATKNYWTSRKISIHKRQKTLIQMGRRIMFQSEALEYRF